MCGGGDDDDGDDDDDDDDDDEGDLPPLPLEGSLTSVTGNRRSCIKALRARTGLSLRYVTPPVLHQTAVTTVMVMRCEVTPPPVSSSGAD